MSTLHRARVVTANVLRNKGVALLYHDHGLAMV
jgi:hypothetical protein